MSEDFDQVAYWRERRRKLRGDHRATENISRPPAEMLQRKIVQAGFFDALARRLLAEKREPASWMAGPGRRALDIGFGAGFLGSLLAAEGLPYAGYGRGRAAFPAAGRVASCRGPRVQPVHSLHPDGAFRPPAPLRVQDPTA